MPESIDAKELQSILSGRMGLIIGPGATLNLQSTTAIQEHIADAFGVPSDDQLFDVTEHAVAGGASLKDIRERIDSYVSTCFPGLHVAHLIHSHWSAVLSFAWDRNLETALQEQSLSSPAREDVLTVKSLRSVIPPRIMPSFKLLGTLGTPDYEVDPNYWTTGERFLDRGDRSL